MCDKIVKNNKIIKEILDIMNTKYNIISKLENWISRNFIIYVYES